MATQQGYILIADITGYTQYLNESELDHAQKTLTALLTLLIRQTRPPLTISRLAGDAVISYGLRDNFFQGQTFIELIEDTYVAFRGAIDMMVMNTTCACNACRNIGRLDLKFFVHFGSFGLQKLDQHSELVGSDVNLIHRLLKNRVAEATGLRAYALFTDAAVTALGIEDIRSTLVAHTERYEHLGEVSVWVQDMHPVWLEKKEALDIHVPPGDILFVVETEIALPQELVWDYLASVDFRKTLMGSDSQVIDKRKAGRVSIGSAYICYHGEKINIQTIVLWKPFDHMITHDLVAAIPFPNTSVVVDYRLEKTEAGTRFLHGYGKAVAGSGLAKLLVRIVMPTMKKGAQQRIDAFRDAVEQDFHASSGGEAAAIPTDEMVAEAAHESLSAGP